VCRHDYLWQSEEFEGFVRSTPEHDLLPNLKEKIKFENGKHVKEEVTIEPDILERIYRYERIMKGLIYRNAEVKKFILRPTDQMEDLFNKTKVFTDSTIPWFKNLIPVLKTLMDKMVAEKAS
jgi:hypothetical protein